ncbi:MAG: pilin [Patescibacteria group bacterium]
MHVRTNRLLPFFLGMVPAIMLGYFGLVFITPASAQTSSSSVSDECHITTHCLGTDKVCTKDSDCLVKKCVSTAIRLNYHIPGVTEMLAGDETGKKYPYVQNMSCFIADMYRYLAGIAGILAVVMMIYGGIKYTVSFGNPSKLQDARDTISSAMIGLALVLGSYVILNFINPKITSLKVPGLQPIAKNELGDPTVWQGIKICTLSNSKLGGALACGAYWHGGKDDQCTIVSSSSCGGSKICTMARRSLDISIRTIDNKSWIACDETVPVKYMDKDWQATGDSDEFCGFLIFDDGIIHDNIRVGTKCQDDERGCGIDLVDYSPIIYGPGEKHPPGMEDEKYIGKIPSAKCY